MRDFWYLVVQGAFFFALLLSHQITEYSDYLSGLGSLSGTGLSNTQVFGGFGGPRVRYIIKIVGALSRLVLSWHRNR